MAKFIRIKDMSFVERLLNVDHIAQICKSSVRRGCIIYMVDGEGIDVDLTLDELQILLRLEGE